MKLGPLWPVDVDEARVCHKNEVSQKEKNVVWDSRKMVLIKQFAGQE